VFFICFTSSYYIRKSVSNYFQVRLGLKEAKDFRMSVTNYFIFSIANLARLTNGLVVTGSRLPLKQEGEFKSRVGSLPTDHNLVFPR